MKPVAKTANKRHGCVVFKDDSEDKGPLLYVTGMAVDGDGSPHCYHPDGKGLDDNRNAYDPERKMWVGVVVDKQGNPVVQGPGSAAPGYWLSPTSLQDKSFPSTDSRRYVNSEEIPYFAFARKLKDASGARDVERLQLGVNLGDYGVMYHITKKTITGGLFADVGPGFKLGEASVRSARDLGLPPSPRNGGEDHPRVAYVVFPESNDGDAWPRDGEAVKAKAMALFEKWGGLPTLLPLIDTLKAQSFEAIQGPEDELAADLPTAADRAREDEPVVADPADCNAATAD